MNVFYTGFLVWLFTTIFGFGIIQAILTFFNDDREHNSRINFVVSMLVSILVLLPVYQYSDIFNFVATLVIVYIGLGVSYKYKDGIK